MGEADERKRHCGRSNGAARKRKKKGIKDKKEPETQKRLSTEFLPSAFCLLASTFRNLPP
jgi:hypothetical protein